MIAKRKKYLFNVLNAVKFKQKHKFFAFFILLILLIYLYLKFLAIPIVVENTQTQIKTFATKSINLAVAETMLQNVSYGDMVNIVCDSENRVAFIEANSIKINLLSKSISKVVMENFIEFSKSPIKISMGSFSGISIFAGSGPKIAFDVNPFGEAKCSFMSTFESAGINQTYHKIYMLIKMNVYVVLPFKKLDIKNESQVLLSETLIVGEIPDVYLNSGNLTDMLNLVPDRFTS